MLVEGYLIQFHAIPQHKNISDSQIKLGRKHSTKEENLEDVMQGSHCRDPKQLTTNLFLVKKKDGEPTGNKLETSKLVYTLPVPGDGAFSLFSKQSRKGRLHVQTRFGFQFH